MDIRYFDQERQYYSSETIVQFKTVWMKNFNFTCIMNTIFTKYSF